MDDNVEDNIIAMVNHMSNIISRSYALMNEPTFHSVKYTRIVSENVAHTPVMRRYPRVGRARRGGG